MIVDANVLIYATDRTSPFHQPAARWLAQALEGEVRVALPLQSVGAFVRIMTQSRATQQPITMAQAWRVVDGWFEAPAVWVPGTSDRTVRILRDLMLRHHLGSRMTTDSQLAALAIEHGLPIVSADANFARFPEIRWINPLADA